MADVTNASITVRVQARGGKFLGDIGGAAVTIRDAMTGELFATGTTAGGSGTPSATYASNASLSTIGTPGSGQSTVQWLLLRGHRDRPPAEHRQRRHGGP